MKYPRLIVVLSVVGICLGLHLDKVNAAVSNSEISVAPFLQEVQIDNNAPKNFNVGYSNDSNESQDLVLSVVDFGSLDKTGGVAFVGSNFGKLQDKYGLSKWLTLSENQITLLPHEKKQVQAIIVSDPAMSPGGHYAAIVATVLKPSSGSKNEVSLKQKISSLVFATKTGGEKYDIKLSNIDSDRSLLHLPAEADITIQSTGNVHVVPRGNVYLKDSSGAVLSKGVINEESGYVLPDTSRVFTVKLNKISSPKPWVSSFNMQVDYRYDGIDQYATKSTSFKTINPVLILLIVASFGFIFVIIKIVSNRFKK